MLKKLFCKHKNFDYEKDDKENRRWVYKCRYCNKRKYRKYK